MADSLILTCPVLPATITRSDLVRQGFALTRAGAPMDNTGYTLAAAVYASLDPGTAPLYTLDAGYTDADPATGLIFVDFTAPRLHPTHTAWRLWRVNDADATDRLHLLRGPLEAEGPGVEAAP